jgi:hypothetical protein
MFAAEPNSGPAWLRPSAEAGGGEKGVDQIHRPEADASSTERQQRGSCYDDACTGDNRQRDALTKYEDGQASGDEWIEVGDRRSHRGADFFDADKTEQPPPSCADNPRQHEEGNGSGPIGVHGLQQQDGAPQTDHSYGDVNPEPDIEIAVL